MVRRTTEERIWCSHCGIHSIVRFEGDSVKACSMCGKILEDETGTAEEYTRLFLQVTEGKETTKRKRRCRSEPASANNLKT